MLPTAGAEASGLVPGGTDDLDVQPGTELPLGEEVHPEDEGGEIRPDLEVQGHSIAATPREVAALPVSLWGSSRVAGRQRPNLPLHEAA